jgi:predicted homoserine dehydrogenase-like protein
VVVSASGHVLAWLSSRERDGMPVRVGVVGGGVMGTHLCRLLRRAAGVHPEFMVSRRLDVPGREWAVWPRLTPALAAHADVIVDASGDVDWGAGAALSTLAAGKTFLSFSAETEATVGVVLGRKFRAAGLVCGFADGDQPGVLVRLLDDCRLRGLDVRALVNCKGYLRTGATPGDMSPPASPVDWRDRACGTGISNVVAFTDGTKMQQEMCVVANATGFLPAARGMVGVRTTLRDAAGDLVDEVPGLDAGALRVDYTLGGDFGGGVLALCRDRDEEETRLLRHLKVGAPGDGEGPFRVAFRPYHLCSFEVVASIAEAVMFGRATAPALPDVMARVVTVAKRDLRSGEVLDGLGGRDCRGEVDVATRAQKFLPVGLAAGAVLRRPVDAGDVVAWDDVVPARGTAWELHEQQG